MLYIGLVFGTMAGNIAAHAAKLDPLRVWIATIVLIVPALIGARLLFVASEWKFYRRNPHRIWLRSEGGFMMYGAVPVMLLGSLPLLRTLGLSFGGFWDVSTFTDPGGHDLHPHWLPAQWMLRRVRNARLVRCTAAEPGWRVEAADPDAGD